MKILEEHIDGLLSILREGVVHGQSQNAVGRVLGLGVTCGFWWAATRSMFSQSEQVVDVTIPWVEHRERKVNETGRKLLEQSVQKLVALDLPPSHCQVGKPADEIMKMVVKHKAELIVTGAQGLGALAWFLLGSVSTRVVQRANCAVLVVRS